MHRLSSNATLLLKFFIPVFWIVFFGASTLAALFYQYDYVGNTPAIYFKGGMAKVEICVARGRKLHDKREALKKQDAKRDIDRATRGT